MFSSRREKREAVIRSSLLNQLSESIQSLIQGPGGSGIPRLSSNIPQGPVLGHTENTNVLCSVLEGIFIHDLKDSISDRLSSIFLDDLDRMPVPNFWPVIMVISHRDLLEQVSALSFITNDVGKSRAWMRLSLNQGQLISYMSVLASDERTLKDYYKPTAFLRDLEKCDIMIRVLNPLTGLTFNLSTNAAILNTWTQSPLILSGTWIPANFGQSMAPIMAATDVASTFIDIDDNSHAQDVPQTPLSDQMFDLIINGTPETDFIDNEIEWKMNAGHKLSAKSESSQHKVIDTLDHQTHCAESVAEDEARTSKIKFSDISTNKDESTTSQSGISILECQSGSKSTEEIEDATENIIDPLEASDVHKILRSTSLFYSSGDYSRTLLSHYETESPLPHDQLPDFLMNFSSQPVSPTRDEKLQRFLSNDDDDSDFEFLTEQSVTDEELEKNLPYLVTIQNEKGLDSQGYHCKGDHCKVPIGMIYGKPRLCKFDGHYYCYECHHGEVNVIPARMINNWDFREYAVCRMHKQFLTSILMLPLFNIRLTNSKLYKNFEDLAIMQSLRTQLHFIQAYLFTCQKREVATPLLCHLSCDNNVENVESAEGMAGQELRQLLWPREHIYEHVHLYSIHDLQQVHSRVLQPVVRKAVSRGQVHIMRCPLCCPRGFICELCDNKEIIYPFQLQETYTCSACSGVYHKPCIKKQSQCPKCARFKSRNLVETEIEDDT